MKAFSLVLMSLALSTAAFAAQPISGNDGDTLMSALTQAGSSMNCGAGTCGTTVQDVSCRASKNVVNDQSCRLTIQTESGDQSPNQIITYKQAQDLIDALSSAGLYQCDALGCAGSAKSIDCTIPNNPDGASATCTIE
jgi:hypothetical protein